MKYLIKVIAIILLVGCTSPEKNIIDSNSDWTEIKKRKYFKDSIAYRQNQPSLEKDSINNFLVFYNRFYPSSSEIIFLNNDIIYALELEFIGNKNIEPIDQIRYVFRPAFTPPFSVTLSREKGMYIEGKISDGIGGYFPGYLDYKVKSKISRSYYDSIWSNLQIDPKIFRNERGSWNGDGTIWTIEIIKEGKYYALEQNQFEFLKNDSTTYFLMELGRELVSKSKILDYYSLKNNYSKSKLIQLYNF